MGQSVDPTTLGDGPFLISSEGEYGGQARVFVDVVRGPLDAGSVTRVVGSRWDWPEDRRLDGLPQWHGVSPHLSWRTEGRCPWSIQLAPTTPRVAAVVEELLRDGRPTDEGVIELASWTDAQADRLATLAQQARRKLSPDLTAPLWLMSFDDADDAEAYLRELEYELGERTLPPGEVSFGPGPWMVYSVGYQGDVHEVDLIWGEAHRYSIAGSLRRCWGSGDQVLELRGRWWDVERDGHITIFLGDDPFQVELFAVSPEVARAVAAYRPYHCCGPGIFDLPRWTDGQARRIAAVLQKLTISAVSLVRGSVLDHALRLARPEQLSEALETLAEPAERPIDAGSAADLGVVWAAIEELIASTDVLKVFMVGACVAVELLGDEGPGEYGCVPAGPFHLLWYRQEYRERRLLPLTAVDPAELAAFVTESADQGDAVCDEVRLAAVGDDHAEVSVRYRSGRDYTTRRGRIELPSGRIVPTVG
ncbi:hypothetical protein CLV30_101443 [Haloactinopolyspora alba]|uniref:Uncharacterized protein n=2 Tax=Haloactinopolyspora alba TaxID=648780 RepID=A0A2P8EG74_9ACTN|nr:hypothetical protein CLV30_101443 [Haloactinopolyspora alba]